MPPADLRILPVQSKKQFREFLRLPYRLYRNDPHWIPPLYFERREALHPKKNPFYQHAEVQLFLAYKHNIPVGRISAQVDLEYEKFHGERVGHFGFFESENDFKTASALFAAAENFLNNKNATRSQGPFNFSINQESGLLVEGFDQPLMIMTPYNPPYYEDLLLGAGYQKAKDLYAWWYQAGNIPEGPTQIAEEVAKVPGLTVRGLEKKHIKRDLPKMMEVFNSAWSQNWGFVPLTEAEISQAARELKLLVDPSVAFLGELHGEPAGICLSVPNIYELIHDFRGRLFPINFLKLLWRIKKRKYKSARLMLLGVKKEFRGSALGGLSVLLYQQVAQRGYKAGFVGGELSWTLEDNVKINAGIEFMGGKKIKTFRIYEKRL